MKKFLSLLALSYIGMGAWAQEQYPVNFDKETTSTERRISKIALNSDEKTLASDNHSYRDLHESVIFEVAPGEQLTPKIVLASGHWIHGLCYVDLNKDGQFVLNDNENVSNSVLTGNPGGTINFTSAFTAPSEPGDYRMRFKTEWVGTDNTTDAMNPGGGTEIIKSGIDGSIIDVTLRVTDNYVTYSYKYNGVEKHSQNICATVGNSFPEASWAQPFGINKGAVPAGNVESSHMRQSFDVELTLSDSYPFEFSDNYAGAHWYKLGFRPDGKNYVQYASGQANNVVVNTNLMTAKTYNNYGWAFIGDPFDGFTIVNKAAGETMSLTSANNPRNLVANDGKKWILATPYQEKTNERVNFSLIPADGSTTERNNLQNNTLKPWSGNDVGSAFWVEDFETSVKAEAKSVISAVESSSVLFGDPEVEGSAANIAKQAIDAVDENLPAGTIYERYAEILKTMYATVDNKKIVFYNTNRNNKYMVVVDAVQLAGANEADGRSEFVVNYVNGTDGQFTLKNTATGRYIANTPGTSSRVQLATEAGKFTIKTWGTDNKLAFISVNPTNAQHNSLHLNNGHNVVAWEADGEGNASVWVIKESELTADQLLAGENAVKQQAYVKVNNAKPAASLFGDGLGKYTKNDAYNTIEANIDAKSNDVAFETILAYQTDLNNALKSCFNLPKAGTFLRIKGAKTQCYITGNGTTGRVVLSGNADANTILYYDGAKLIGYKNGLGFNETHSVASIGSFENHTFSASPYQNGLYMIKSNYSGSKVLCDGSSATDLVLNRWGSENDVRSAWTIEEVTEIPVTIASNGLATFYAPVDMQVPDGTTAYAASLDEAETTITYSPFADNIIPAGCGALLKGTNGTINLVPTTGATEKESALVGHEYTVACSQTEESHGASVIYTLQNSGNFMYYTGTKLTGFKAHYELKEDHRASSGNSPLRVVFVDDFTTGIEAVESTSSNEIFDLQGRRVNNALKGLYIVNGRKVIR